MTYYLLAERDNSQSTWFLNFGDYDKDAVEFERQDVLDHGAYAKNLKIIKLRSASQAAVDAAIKSLNV